ncbi:type V CRISPR-associated protein Cas12b [Bacillus sp. V3-13]|uniref:type V CRISPR-associated protein Cas12b n=1 Tax=Bacillus sp. V3-13 TaxID=2053728 RepID=UPI00115A4F7C|nr:type V CRISPR-associated protein Cas12b [Bacillus sp. V3-13]
MNLLTLYRQEAIGDKTKEAYQAELINIIRNQQRNNGSSEEHGSDQEILALLRQLYELIIPSSIGESGDANQLGNKFLYPLVDPNSQSGKGTSNAGRKPRWKRLKEEGNPDWELEKKKDEERKAKDPTVKIFDNLNKYGLLPLFPLFTNIQKDIEWLPLGKRQSVRKWDKDMFIQAIERLLSWESWNRRVADEYKQLKEKTESYYKEHLTGGEEWIEKIRKFEKERNMELEKNAFAPNDGYFITSRQIRGWDRVYEKWSKLPESASPEELWKVVAEQQNKMSEGFGDPKVFSFLANRENRDIWRGHSERIYHIAAYNGLQKKLSRTKEQATFTLPDAIEHPLWIRYESPGGTNLNLFKLEEKQKKNYYVTLSKIIWPSEEKWIEKENIEIPLAPSIQFNRQIKLKQHVKGKQEISFSDYSSRISLDGVLGGSRIQFNRKYIKNHKELLGEGDIGPVFFNLVVDVAPLQETRNGRLQSPIGKALKVISSDFSKVIDYKPKELMDWMNTGSASNSFGVASLLEGMRVMSIDMGQRTSASVSIFEVVKELPKDQEQKLFYSINDTELFAIHKRSFLLNLPGEVVTKNNKQQRQERRKKRQFVRSQIRMLANVLRLETKKTPDERKKAIHKLMEIVQSYDSWTASQKEVWEKELNLLTNMAAFNDEIWKESLVELHHRIEPYVGQIVSKWRKGLSEGRKNLAGISMWNIDELEDTRRLLISWSKRSRTPGEANRIETDEPFGSSLLQHIQNVKDDRLKQMANLIIMTALGFKYDKEEKDRYKRWKETYPACQIILFENLNRYLFNLDRSRRENSRLMKWAHRSIPRTVSMQGEMFGLQVGDVRSEYSSRFHAKTGAPGIRCHALTEEDLKAGSNTLKRLIEDGFINESELAYLKKGDIIPSQGGELFVTLSKRYKKDSDNNELTVIHADINAAQNLQKRFWQQNSEVYRVPCQLARMGEDKLYIPKSQTETIKKYFGKGSFVKNNTEQEVYKWEKSEKMKIKTDTTFDLQDLDGFEDISKTIELAQEQQKKYLTMFRDPSGYFFNNETWRPQKEYWSIVNNIIKSCLKKKILSNKVEL